MKKLYLFSVFLFTCVTLGQDKKINYDKFDRKGMKTSILLKETKPFSPLCQNFETYGMYDLSQAYKELKLSDSNNKFQNLNELENSLQLENTSPTVKIGLVHSEYETISKSALKEGKVKIVDNKVIRKSNDYIFEKFSNTIISPLCIRKKGVQTNFILDSNYFVNTTSNKIETILANFDDGKGFQRIELDKNTRVEYNSEGLKNLEFKVEFENGQSISKKSTLTVNYSNADVARLFRRAVNLIESSRTPDLAIYGELNIQKGKCEYEIFLSPDGVLDKPLYLVDGFDPTDTRNTTAIYNLLTYTDGGGVTRNLGDRIRNEEGYDVVIVNFPNYTNAANLAIDGGADFIERNALSLVTVIETINSQKTGSEQNVIIGPSMGGLISRYALRYMEQNSLNHQTRLWISFDSPHYGANVPIGIQHLFNYFAYGKPNSTAVQPLINGMLRSAAAKQMLVDHFQAHISTGANAVFPDNTVLPSSGLPLLPTGYPGFRDNFQNRMNAMGFPQNTRNISMINGSGSLAKFKAKDGTTDINPGFDFIGTQASPHTIDLGNIMLWVSARAKTFCEFMPTANTQERIVDVVVEYNPFFFYTTYDTFKTDAKQSAGTNGVDSAPAGLFDMSGLAASLGTGNQTLTNFLNAMKADKFSFIPTTSAMGLNVGGNINNPQPNYYFNINLGAKDTPWDGITTTTNNTTPFKNWYMPPTNENHVTVTQGNVDFAWCEIVKPTYTLSRSGTGTITSCANNPITVTLNVNDIKGCNPVNLSATGVSSSLISLSQTSIGTNGNVTMTLTGLPAGNHNITVTANNNVTQSSIVIPVTVNPTNPNLNGTTQFSLNGGTFTTATSATVAPGANVELKIPSNLFNGTLEWFDPQGNLRGTGNLMITNIQDGSVDEGQWIAKVTFTNDCARMAPANIPFTINVDQTLSNIVNEFNSLKVYPVPTENIITISANDIKGASLKIIDLRGRIIMSSKILNNNSENQIDISGLSEGSYFLIIENEKQKIVKSIIKK